jgi:NAD(P)-dependent dehydrogenase (short-subunit alcohol dehydrogenase family)
LLDIWVCRIGPFILRQGALELITEALRMEVKSFGIHITNVAPGDFATIASGRYHAPVIKGSAYEVLMESHCERWMSMSMEVVIQMKWLKL